MTRLISLKCPECGANLSVEEGRTQVFCSYCGTKITINNENEYIFRNIDEAEVKRAEADKEIKLKELELENARLKKDNVFNNTLKRIWLIATIALIVIALGIIFFSGGEDGIGYGFLFIFYVCAPIIGGGAYLIFKVMPEKENDKAIQRAGGIKLPKSLEPLTEHNAMHLKQVLNDLGFHKVKLINNHDIKLGIFANEGGIDSITINGEEVNSCGKYYPSDSSIVITYHGK